MYVLVFNRGGMNAKKNMPNNSYGDSLSNFSVLVVLVQTVRFFDNYDAA